MGKNIIEWFIHIKTLFCFSRRGLWHENCTFARLVCLYSFSNIVSDSYSYPDRKEHGEWPSVDLLTQGFSFTFNSWWIPCLLSVTELTALLTSHVGQRGQCQLQNVLTKRSRTLGTVMSHSKYMYL